MASIHTLWSALRRLIVTGLIYCTYVANVAVAEEGDASRLSALATRLALNSTALRLQIQQVASSEQQVQFKMLGESELRLQAALREARVERTRRQQIDRQLRDVVTERIGLVRTIASLRADFAAELDKINAQFSSEVERASPAKREALERFVSGEPGAYQVLEKLTYAENETIQANAIANAKRNLAQLLDLSLQNFFLRDAGSMDRVIAVAKDLLRYDEQNLDAIHWVVLSMALEFKDREIVRFCDEIAARSADEVFRLNVTVMSLRARLSTQPYEVAELPVRDALIKLESKVDGVNQVWAGPHWVAYCRGVLELAEQPHYLLANEQAIALVQRCVTQFGEKRTDIAKMLSGLTWIARHYAIRGQLSLAKRFRAIADQLVDSVAQAGPECPECAKLGQWLRWQQLGYAAQVLALEGYRQRALDLNEQRVASYQQLIGKFPNSPEVERELSLVKARWLAAGFYVDTKLQRAADALGTAIGLYALGTLPTEPSSVDDQWLVRADALGQLSMVQVRLGRLSDAQRTLDEAGGILRALQLIYPLGEPDLTYARHSRVYATLMELALARSTVRELQGNSAQAAVILRQVRTSLTGQLDAPIYADSFRRFDIAVDLQLASIASRSGRAAEAIDLLRSGARKVAALRAAGSEAFEWRESQLEFRFRLAQVQEDVSEVEAVRTEVQSLPEGRVSISPTANWAPDLTSWKLGSPIRWLPQVAGGS